jgi:hypothetical protein
MEIMNSIQDRATPCGAELTRPSLRHLKRKKIDIKQLEIVYK